MIAAIVTFWLILPATPELRQRLLAHRVVTLGRRVEELRDAIAASRAHDALRVAVLQFLALSDHPGDRLNAALVSLAQARKALVCRQQYSDDGNRPASMSHTNDGATERPSTIPGACTAPATRRHPAIDR